ncbi:histone deacetylase HDAC2 [Toxoplasma gondii VAND]|uniref:Histone deacetylase HDAC2 n=1 Tax=Toxoplasma gondii VAND TaxID=933077 RepID=A0A086QH70_TOXGO|nr:histone deacetylase HDAC2 [Toxoplasma gondii VAND]
MDAQSIGEKRTKGRFGGPCVFPLFLCSDYFLDDSVMDKSDQIRALLADEEEEKAMDSSGDAEDADGAGRFEEISNRNRG